MRIMSEKGKEAELKKKHWIMTTAVFTIIFIFTASLKVQAAASVIADHNHASLETIQAIPDEKIDALHSKQIYYGHTSHGSQVTVGLSDLPAFAGSKYAVTIDEEYGDLGSCDWETLTRNHLASNTDTDIVMWSWCGQVSGYSQSQINTYLSKMSHLEEDYPAVVFVYMTGHLDGSGEDGNLNLRNQQIRDYCTANGKVLYDFADIESYDPDGNYYLNKGATDACDYDSDDNGSTDKNWAIDWQNSHTKGVDWYDTDAAHSQPLNGNRKAYAAWYLFSQIVGKDAPRSISDCSIKEISPVTYTGSPICPDPIVMTGDRQLIPGTDYTLEYTDNINAGTAAVKITGIGSYMNSKTAEFTIEKAEGTISMPQVSYTLHREKAAFNLGASCVTAMNGLEYESDNTDIVTVSVSGDVLPSGNAGAEGLGTAHISVRAPESANYKETEKIVSITMKDLISITNPKTKGIVRLGSVSAPSISENTIYVGHGKTFIPVVSCFSPAMKQTLTWEKVTAGNDVTCSSKGKITVGMGATQTPVQIKVSVQESSVTYDKYFYIMPTQLVTGVTLDDTSLSLTLGGDSALATHTLHAEVTTTGNPVPVVFRSTNTKVATVDDRGVIKAVGKGAATILAVAGDGSQKSASCRVKVVKLVTSITVNNMSTQEILKEKDIIWIAPGMQIALKGKTDAGASNQKVAWSGATSTDITVSPDGKIRAGAGATESTPEVIITCNSADGNKSVEFTVKVTPAGEKITLNESKVTLKLGGIFAARTADLDCIVTDYDGKEITPRVYWKSSNPKAVTVDQDGTITAVKKGSSIISCQLKDGTKKKVSCKVSVIQLVTSLTLKTAGSNGKVLESGDTLSMGGAASVTIGATINKDASDKSLIWSVLDNKGKKISTGSRVTIKAENIGVTRATVVCRSGDGNRSKVFYIEK